MTTEQAVNPCLGERCEECGQERQHDNHAPGFTGRMHLWEPHEHVPLECSARVYRDFFGCDVRFHAHHICYRHEEHGVTRPKGERHFIPDIIYAPSTSEAWLAMRDVLAEAQRRGWFADIDVSPEGASMRFGTNRAREADGSPWFDDAGAALPRAVALAAWAAHRAAGEVNDENR